MRSALVKWIAGVVGVLLIIGIGWWAYGTGRAPAGLSSAPQATSSAAAQASSTPASATGTAAGMGGVRKGGSAGSAALGPCPALGLSHAQDAANAAAAGKNVAAHYGIASSAEGLTSINYRCNLMGAAGIQRSYGFFVGDAASGTKYSWYNNGNPATNQFTKLSILSTVPEIPASGWSMSSVDAINAFMESGGSQYYRTMLPQSSAIQLMAGLSMSSGVPVWNISIQTWLPSGAIGPLFSRAYNAVTGAFCGNANCSS